MYFHNISKSNSLSIAGDESLAVGRGLGEYGKSSYKLRGNVGNGDGDSHYAGGGIMAKWTNKHDVYTEASFRMGRICSDEQAASRRGRARYESRSAGEPDILIV